MTTNFDINTPQGMQNSVAWTNNMLRQIKSGGVWFVPRCASSYVVDHDKKTLTRKGMKPDKAINRVLAEAGWKVIE
jgi:hypothetical protein